MKRFIWLASLLTLIIFAVYANGDGEEADVSFEDITLEEYSRATVEDLSFDFQWKVDGDVLHVQMAAPTTGWISVGFDPEKMMGGADIIIGYVSDGTVFLSDDFGSGNVKHEKDISLGGEDNILSMEGEEIEGATRIRFSIPLDSGDSYDKPLVPGNEYKVIVAYGPDGSDDFGTYHSRTRGSFDITL